MNKIITKLTLLTTLLFSLSLFSQNVPKINSFIDASNVKYDNFEISFENERYYLLTTPEKTGILELKLNDEDLNLNIINGKVPLDKKHLKDGLNFIKSKHSQSLIYASKNKSGGHQFKKLSLWLSILPPLIAIGFALVFREVILALFAGIWTGSFILNGLSLSNLIQSFFDVITKYIIGALTDSGHMSIIIFSMLIGGMVALISKNGGMMGIVNALSKYARSRKSAQFITWLMGIAIFFDDYANTLVVGNTMRSVTDKFKISREKLAYIVDSTAAPVAAIAFITTWIGAELGYIDDGLTKIGMDVTPYAVFLQSLKYAFYPVLAIVFIIIIIVLKKDFGKMAKAEQRAYSTGQVSPAKTKDEDEPDMEDFTPLSKAPQRWIDGVIPILTVITVTIIGLVITGFDGLAGTLSDINPLSNYDSWNTCWSDIKLLNEGNDVGMMSKLGYLIGSSDSYIALLWSSLAGVLVAFVLSVLNKSMSLFDASHWMITGFKSMMPAFVILTLAWSLAITTDHLHTADFLSDAVQGNVHPYFIPAIIFILAALIAFSTGSSWSTMAILYPIAIPAAYGVCQSAGLSPELSYEILLSVIATVLGASVLGDHCSPISDTTILSSLASDCNHIDHVSTQLPYAVTVGLTSITGLTLSIVFGGGFFVTMAIMLLCIVVLWFIVRQFGTEVK